MCEAKKRGVSVPLTMSQTGIYLECAEAPETTKYNVFSCCRLPKGTEKGRFTEAVRQAVLRNPAFFAVIRTVDGVPSMVRLDRPFEVEERIGRKIEEETASFIRPFDLENGPLFRMCYLSTPEGDAFLFDVHHIIFDGSSVGIFLRQVATAYDGVSVTGESPSFFDFALRETEQGSVEERDRFIRILNEKFDAEGSDSRPVPDEVTGSKRKRIGTVTADSEGMLKPEEVSLFASKRGITENAVLLGAFGFVLGKFNGTPYSTFTTVHHGRKKGQGMENVIGMFVKTLPISCRFTEDVSTAEFLKAAADDYYLLRQNDAVPFSEIAEKYGVSTAITFAFQAELFGNLRIGAGELSVEMISPEEPISDIEFLVLKDPDRYRLEIRYDESLYTEGFIESFADAYLFAARQMLCAEKLSEVELVSLNARKLIDSFNETETPYDTEHTLVDLFRQRASEAPDRECLVYEDHRFTYAEVDRITDRLAKCLKKKGIGRGDVVGILIPRSEFMLLSPLGVLKSGAAYLPLDPAYPEERLNTMIEDSNAALLITTEELNARIGEALVPDRMMTEEILELPDDGTELPAPEKDDLFVLLYTSGSTGKPKGVRFLHRNAMVTAAWERSFYKLGPDSRVSAYASFGFDANVFDTYAAVSSGAALYVISDEIRLDLPALQRYFNAEGITNALMTTQVGRQFALMEGTKTLKTLSVGGEKLTPLDPPEDYDLLNLYGPTEGSVLVTGFRVDRHYRDIPIGKAIDNVKLYVVDPDLKMLGIGAVGELIISGPHVTGGYLNRPDKTAEAFIDDPFSNAPGYEKAYRTGDYVRLLPDGNVQFIGRRDAQVKIRGFRIELTEIEEVILRYPGIKSATVAAFDDANGGKYIAAYVVSDEQVDVERLNGFIREEKPSYMVPAVTMQLERLPLNQNHKVDRKSLPKPEKKPEAVVLPETETEKQLFELAADAIGHRSFGVESNLFDAGLTSVGLLRLNVLISKAFDVTVKLNDLKTNDTIRKLDAFLKNSVRQETYDVQADYPITETMKGIFVECSREPESVRYNIPLLFRLDSSIDPDRLLAAVRTAVKAHPYLLATLFMDETGEIRAKRDPEAKIPVERVFFETLPEAEELVLPFDLIGGPLSRFRIIETPESRYLFIDMHHIISDGTSAAILLNDIDRSFSGLPVEMETYTGFEAALEEEKLRKTEKLEEAKAFYDRIFRGCETESLPARTETCESTGALSYEWDLGPKEAVLGFCKENRLSPNAFFNAAFGFTLGRFVPVEDVVFTTVYNGRNDSRLRSSVTMLVKTIPVMVRTGENREIVEFIRETEQELVGSMANDLCSFAEISSTYGIRADVIFSYQGDSFVFDQIGGKPAELVRVAPDNLKAPITITVEIRDGRIKVNADFDRSFYGASFAEGFLDAFCRAVDAFTKEKEFSSVSLLSGKTAERLKEINDTAVPFRRVSIPDLFREEVKKHPDRTAVSGSGRTLTYRELDALSNRISNALIALGVENDTVIGMMLDRTVELSFAELGIMKAGGAFLGLLPTYPDERVDFCLTDAASPFVVTTEAILQEKTELFSAEKPYRALTIEALLEAGEDRDPKKEIAPENLAYCIYTSGSTGKPKGVLIEHHSIVNFVQQEGYTYEGLFGSKGGDVSLAMSSISFDMSIMEHLPFLMNGKAVVIATEAEVHDPSKIAALIGQYGVNAILATPSLLSNYLDSTEFTGALRRMKSIMVGAEAFPAKLYDALKNLAPEARIINGYGPTECCISCAAKELKSKERITIGGPQANMALYVVDRFGNVLPPYGTGEMIIAGECVGRGYINLPEKNRECFFEIEGKKAYRSGDIVRLNEDGEAEYFGRKDDQVKLRGFRIELSEIEKTIHAFPGILQTKVIVRNNGSEDYLAAFFTAEDEIDVKALSDFLKTSLTYYMVPDVMMQLEKMPLNASGKIDKKALPEVKKTTERKEKKKPKKSLEEELCNLFGSVLSVEEYYADDNFFEMGGTSLSASKVIMKLMSMGIRAEYQDIFDCPTPELLAERVGSKPDVGEKLRAEESGKTAAKGRPETEDRIAEVLKFNTLEHAAKVTRKPVGDVLLTGAVGFLGIHILKELLDAKEGKVIAVIRGRENAAPERRLKNMLMYYFGTPFEEELKDRITVIDEDVTDDGIVEKLKDLKFDTIINSAAVVKHFAADDVIEKANVHGVENLIRVAEGHGARLIQISTASIPGAHTEETYANRVKMYENELFVIDSMDNKYLLSKYHAELRMVDAIREGLKGKIIRVGNLMGRQSDGEFQINSNTNAFLNALRGFSVIGKSPLSHTTDPIRLSPIDMTAKAIVLLSGTNDEFTAFHADNRFGFDEMQLIDACNRAGLSIVPVPDEEYYGDFRRMLADEKLNSVLSALITNDRPDTHMAETDNTFTANVLYRLGFSWPLVDTEYLDRLIEGLETLAFFDTDDSF